MKKIESTSAEYLILQIVAIAIAGMVIWPLLDLFWCAVITHSAFVYSVADHIVEPIIFGCICGLVFWIIERKKAKK